MGVHGQRLGQIALGEDLDRNLLAPREARGSQLIQSHRCAGLEAGLDPNSFVRIHRSYIVNLERVARIEPYGKDSRLAILTDGTTRLPVSRAGYARLKALLDERK